MPRTRDLPDLWMRAANGHKHPAIGESCVTNVLVGFRRAVQFCPVGASEYTFPGSR